MQAQEIAVPAAKFADLRRTAVDCQIRPFGVTDQRILASFLDVPRENFVPAGFEPVAYVDVELTHPLSGGKGGRAMLLPLVLARLLQAAEIGPGDRVLDVAGGAGYTAAILGGLAGSVVALESDEALSKAAAANFESLGLSNVTAVCGALKDGAAGKGPFNVIVVNGAAQDGLEKLAAQLAPAGRMVVLKPHAYSASRAFLCRKDGETLSERALFEAAGKLIPEFSAAPAFVF